VQTKLFAPVSGLKIRIQAPVRVQPGDTVSIRAVVGSEKSPDNDLSVCLYGGGPNKIVCPRTAGLKIRIQAPVCVQPGDIVSAVPLY
jgi:hypothetical protein